MMRRAFSLVGAIFRHESVATSDLSHSSDCSVSPGGWSGSACVVQDSPHVGPSNRVTVPRNRLAGRHACRSPGHKRPAAPMAHQRGVKPACLWPANHAACAHRDRSGGRAGLNFLLEKQRDHPGRQRSHVRRPVLIPAEFRAGKLAVPGAYSENGDNCPMQLRCRVQTH